MVDTNQIQQVFLNIIINAEQAMRGDDGGERHAAHPHARVGDGSVRRRSRTAAPA